MAEKKKDDVKELDVEQPAPVNLPSVEDQADKAKELFDNSEKLKADVLKDLEARQKAVDDINNAKTPTVKFSDAAGKPLNKKLHLSEEDDSRLTESTLSNRFDAILDRAIERAETDEDKMGLKAVKRFIANKSEGLTEGVPHSDGWDEDALAEVVEHLDELQGINYEINNCVKGSHTGCDTYEELGYYIIDVANDLINAADNIRDLEEDPEEDGDYDESLKAVKEDVAIETLKKIKEAKKNEEFKKLLDLSFKEGLTKSELRSFVEKEHKTILEALSIKG